VRHVTREKLMLPRLTGEEEENPENWEPFRDAQAMMAEAEKQLASDNWQVTFFSSTNKMADLTKKLSYCLRNHNVGCILYSFDHPSTFQNFAFCFVLFILYVWFLCLF